MVALVVSGVAAAIILVAWFPAGALIDQRHTLSSTASTLSHLRAENAALRAESKNLSTPSEIARIARQQFQLIVPGEQAYQVLPPPGTPDGSTDPYSGDPGSSTPVSPSAAPELPPGAVAGDQTTAAGTKTHHASTAASPGLFGRLLRTLEFWR